MDYLNLYGRYIIVYLKSRMEYKFPFCMNVLAQVIQYVSEYLGIWIILYNFKSLLGWNYYDLMFLFNLNVFSYCICGMVVKAPMVGLEEMIHRGTFDSILISPINPLAHLIFKQFNHNFFGSFLVSLVVFWICLTKIAIDWNVFKVIWFIIVLISTVLIQASIMLIAASLNFWLTKSSDTVLTFIYSIRRFIMYPISIYSRWIQLLLTLVIPYAFVNFYPSIYFLNKPGEYLFHPVLQFGTPVVGIVFALIAYQIWRSGISHYQSTGS